MSDQCFYCSARGDLSLCLQTTCFHHENWMVKQLKNQIVEYNPNKTLMPKELTAENGAKALLIGEFEEQIELNCFECDGDGDPECEICEGSTQYFQPVPVSWTTIKEIYKKAVEYFNEKGD